MTEFSPLTLGSAENPKCVSHHHHHHYHQMTIVFPITCKQCFLSWERKGAEVSTLIYVEVEAKTERQWFRTVLSYSTLLFQTVMPVHVTYLECSPLPSSLPGKLVDS